MRIAALTNRLRKRRVQAKSYVTRYPIRSVFFVSLFVVLFTFSLERLRWRWGSRRLNKLFKGQKLKISQMDSKKHLHLEPQSEDQMVRLFYLLGKHRFKIVTSNYTDLDQDTPIARLNLKNLNSLRLTDQGLEVGVGISVNELALWLQQHNLSIGLIKADFGDTQLLQLLQENWGANWSGSVRRVTVMSSNNNFYNVRRGVDRILSPDIFLGKRSSYGLITRVVLDVAKAENQSESAKVQLYDQGVTTVFRVPPQFRAEVGLRLGDYIIVKDTDQSRILDLSRQILTERGRLVFSSRQSLLREVQRREPLITGNEMLKSGGLKSVLEPGGLMLQGRRINYADAQLVKFIMKGYFLL